MIRSSFLTLAVALMLGSPAAGSECALTIEGEKLTFQHVVARAKPNHFDDTKEDIVVHCFREEVPEDKRSPSEIIWFRPESGRIDIELSPDGYVTVVDLTSDAVQGMISGVNFGVVFEGQRDCDRITGTIQTTEDKTTFFNGEESAPWRLSATLDVEVISESD